MSIQWRFTPKMPAEKTRDPVAGEFFAQDAIKNAGEALVREAIQNSLDARVDRQNGQAKVRIYLSGSQGAVRSGDHAKWFGTAWEHYAAPKNGLRAGFVARDKPCSFLVFEDFGTTGLTGDWEQTDVIDGAKNAFFYFFRAEGATEKSSDQLGRWGIGKQVFPRSSHAQTLFGFSVTRENPDGFLMGSCILKHHKVDDITYRPDGYFGESKDLGRGQEISVPTRDAKVLEGFRAHFNLRRRSGQAGLSVVVPWLDEGEDGASGFARDSILSAIFDGYYMPILEGKLEVEVEDASGSVRINADTFAEALASLIDRVRPEQRKAKGLRRTQALVRLSEQIRGSEPLTFDLQACSPTKAEWAEGMLDPDVARRIREALAQDRLVRVRASLTVRSKLLGDHLDGFTCYLRKEDGFNEKPCHIREDLIISNVTSGRTNGFVSIVRIDAGRLANLLGDSENPAHTEWQATSQNFKDKYVYGGMAIKFVADFATELLRRVHASDAKLDKDLLLQYFNDPGPEAPVEGKPRKKERKDDDQGDKVDPPVGPLEDLPESRAELRITPLVDGFTVSSTGWPVDEQAMVEIRAAYETSKGNPFKAYRPYDFDFRGHVKGAEQDGCSIAEAADNRILLNVEAPAFSVTVKGFDVNRDLIVRAAIKKQEQPS